MSTIDSTLATDRTSSLDDTDKVIIMKASNEMSDVSDSDENLSGAARKPPAKMHSPFAKVFLKTVGKVRSTLFGSAEKRQASPVGNQLNPTLGPSGDSHDQPTHHSSLMTDESTSDRPINDPQVQGARPRDPPITMVSKNNELYAQISTNSIDFPASPEIDDVPDFMTEHQRRVETIHENATRSRRNDFRGLSQKTRNKTERNPVRFGRHTSICNRPPERQTERFTVAPVLYKHDANPQNQLGSYPPLRQQQTTGEDYYDCAPRNNEKRHKRPTPTNNRNDDSRRRDDEDGLDVNGGPSINVYGPNGIRNRHRPLVMPDRFDGIISWEDYKSHFQYCSLLNGWNVEQKGQFLAALLSGPAQKILKRLETSGEVTYTRLVNQLDNQYGTAGQAEKILFQLQSRRRRRDESLAEFGNSILELTEQAYPELDSTAVDRLA